jgi:hypothetical protein
LKPTTIFRMEGWNSGIVEYPVLSISPKLSRYRPQLTSSRANKKLIEEMVDYVLNYKPIDVVVVFAIEHGTSGFLFSELDSGQEKRIALNRESLVPIYEEHLSKYKPRENHFACRYCRVQTPNEKKFTSTIIGRDRKQVWNSWKGRYESKAYCTNETLDFCSPTCASHEQFSREG